MIHFKNILFKQDKILSFETENDNTTIVLEDCIFNCTKLNLSDGNYLLINPIFKKECIIDVDVVEDIDITLSEESSNIELYISGYNNIYLEYSPKIKNLKIKFGEKIHLKNIKDSKNLKYQITNSDQLILEDSNLYFNSNSYISRINEIKLLSSKIESKDNIVLFYINKLLLQDSSISTPKTISIKNLKNLEFKDKEEDTILDTSSYLEAGESIILGELPSQKYDAKDLNNPIIITKENYSFEQAYTRRLLINTLKEINLKLESDIKKSIKKEKEELLKQLEEKQQNLLTKKIKHLD